MKEKNQPSEKAKTEKISFTIPPIKGRNFDLEDNRVASVQLKPFGLISCP